ncbi:MAG: response regulator [Enhydrobacter sp.]|nr:MAG: response regulator [Enhydrobacter sp.]
MTNIPSGPQWATSQCDVLIVEDDVVQAEEMAAFLARAGLSVQIAHNGVTALPLAQQLQPRVALLDYNLPDLNGVELATAIRGLLPDTAIIMMSGRIEGLAELTLEKIGISVFVNKPVPLGPLRQAVQRLVKSGRPVRRPGTGSGGWFAGGVGSQRA